MEQSLRGHHAGLASCHTRRLIRVLAVVLALDVLGAAFAARAQCGNGIVDTGEDCDDGGTCIGGSNAGTHCTAETDCIGNGVCVGGPHARAVCTNAAACPGGVCAHCVPQGGDGCAANCTLESDVPYPLSPGELGACAGGVKAGHACSIDAACPGSGCSTLSLVNGTSGVAMDSDFISLPEPFGGACYGGNNANFYCLGDADCPGGTCVQSQQVLTVGKEKNGTIPVVVRAASIQIPGIHPGIGCGCIRGVPLATCGGVLFDVDGATPATDCTPGYTSGDNVCTAAGEPPCTFVHGEGNSPSGEIGCEGLENINVAFTQDSGGASGIVGPPVVTLSGSGGPGSASVLSSIGITVVLGTCTGTDPVTYGPDGIFCTADDPPGGLIAIEATSPAVTGVAQAQVLNANGTDGVNWPSDGPVTVTGAPFSCAALAQGSAAGAGLVQAATVLHLDTVGDIAITAQFFANGTVPPTPTPTPTPVALCVGDCNGRGEVTVNEPLAIMNIALGNALPSACPNGIPAGGEVDIAVIIQALNNALYGCGRFDPRTRSG